MKQTTSSHTHFLLQLLQALGLVLFLYLLIWHIMLYSYISLFNHSPENLKTTIIHYLLIHDSSGFLQISELTLYERRHLFDVKRLFQSLEHLFVYSLIYSSIIFILIKLYNKKLELNFLWLSYLGLTPLFLMSCAILIFGFLPTFNYLHSLFFPPQSWIFPKDSTLIQLFPLHYFFQFALTYLSLLLSVFLFFLWFGQKRKVNNNKKNSY